MIGAASCLLRTRRSDSEQLAVGCPDFAGRSQRVKANDFDEDPGRSNCRISDTDSHHKKFEARDAQR